MTGTKYVIAPLAAAGFVTQHEYTIRTIFHIFSYIRNKTNYMERFPELESHQVVVVTAEVNSGQILNIDLLPDQQNGRGVYKVFDSVQDALAYAKSVITEKKVVECVIQGPGQETIHYITPTNVKEF
jgi:hypothetical protein